MIRILRDQAASPQKLSGIDCDWDSAGAPEPVSEFLS